MKKYIKDQLNKLPPHEGLGEIELQDADEDGDIPFYRPCLYRWSKEEIAKYEAENDKAFFCFAVTGANPIFGATAWILKEESE